MNKMNNLLKQENIFKALSDKSRLRIIKMLQKKPMCVCEITEILQLATSTVSNHLSILTEAGIINGKKDGKWINYEIINSPDDDGLSSVLMYMHLILNDDETVLNDRKLILKTDRNDICNK